MRKIVSAMVLATTVGVVAVATTARGQGGPPPPPFGGTSLPGLTPPPAPGGPTATATATLPPTSTATSIPLTLSVKLAHGTVAPRSQQTVSVTTLPGAGVTIVVHFPNGDTKRHAGVASDAGKLRWTYKQAGSRITHASRTAKVSVVASDESGSKSATKRYTIGFAQVDVSVQPRTQKTGRAVSIWVHSSAFTIVQVRLTFSNGSTARFRTRTGSDGWAYRSYVVAARAPKGRVAVKAFAGPQANISGETSFRVK